MKYKLYPNSANDIRDIIGTTLHNRGIENVDEYLNCLKTQASEDWKLLDNIDKAIELFDKHFQNRDKIVILADNDNDGINSSVLTYKYIKDLEETLNYHKILNYCGFQTLRQTTMSSA